MDQVLVVYLFAPLCGPGAEAAFDYLRAVWQGCGTGLGMDQAISATGVPIAAPASLADLETIAEIPPTGIVLSARAGRDVQAGRSEALLRLHHEVLSLAVRLGPPAGLLSWRELDLRWSEVSGMSSPAVSGASVDLATSLPPPALIGGTRVYLGLTDDQDQRMVDPDTATARRLLPMLPVVTGDQDWTARGAATRSGYALWELADRPEGRAERRIVAIAPQSRETRLSAWLWSRGTAEMPPFGYYLLQAAKIRYMARVWDDGRPVRRTRASLDEATGTLAQLLYEAAGASSSGAGAAPAADFVNWANDLRRWSRTVTAVLRAQSSEILDIAQSVDIARSNMAEAFKAETPIEFDAGLFGDDAAMSDLFLRRLADERSYLERALNKARSTEDLATATFGALSPVRSAGPVTVPGRLEDPERGALLRALATAFYQPDSAIAVLEAAGLDLALQAQIGPHSALAAWTKNLRELEQGRVADPHRRIVREALRSYPNNEIFQAAAERLGISG